MTKKILTTLAFGLAVTLPSAFASTITLAPGGFTGAPGSNSVPSNGSTFAGLTLVADTGVLTLVNGPGSNTNATADERIYRTTGGTLDFFVQVHNLQGPSVDNLRTVDVRNFTGFTTAVAYNTNSGTVMPSDANRTAGTGDTINFGFFNSADNSGTLGTDAPDGIGSTSYWLEIDTNATGFTNTGQVGVIDGGTASVLAYSPTNVPEPMSMGLLGGGLALLGIARLRKAAKKA